MRGRLFARPCGAPDARPALFSVVALMVLLVPMVLLTSTGQKAAGMALGLPGPNATLPAPVPGPVERLRIEQLAQGYRLEAALRRTDVLANTGDVEQQELVAADLADLQAHLLALKALDPSRQRVTLAPSADSSAEQVVQLMDAVRTGPTGPLFPEIVVEAAQ